MRTDSFHLNSTKVLISKVPPSVPAKLSKNLVIPRTLMIPEPIDEDMLTAPAEKGKQRFFFTKKKKNAQQVEND